MLRDLLTSTELDARILRAVACAVGFWLAAFVCAFAVRRFLRRGASDEPRSALVLALKPLRTLVLLLGLDYALHELGISTRSEKLIEALLYISAVIFGTVAVIRLLQLALNAYVEHAAPASRERLEREYVPLLRKIAGVLIATLTLMVALHHFGVGLTALSPILTTLGVGGLAVGFAAKETLSNMIAGFTILIDRPFRPGDRIKLATGEVGDVMEIGIRSTRIRLLDQNLLVVPNADLTNSRIVNYNFPSNLGQGTVEIRVAYGTDLPKLEQMMLELAKADKALVSEPKPQVMVRRFSDGGVDVALLFFVAEYGDAAGAEDRLRRALHARLHSESIGLSRTQHEVRMMDSR